ncbi:MAG TPA: hypothetical protein VHV10_02850 [Ktedonobacteraceae bacterium]|nr:hypothetical protein [Ktedonobacteraceae bacterium]
MAQSPWPQGDTLEPWTFQLIPDSGDFDTSGLTESNFTYFQRNISNGIERPGDGVFSNLLGASGGDPAQITYQQSVNDVASLGTFRQQIKATSGGKTQTFDFGVLSIEPT